MITIEITKNSLMIEGHANSTLCSSISLLSQYICSCLEPYEYQSQYGYLKAKFQESQLSEMMLAKFLDFLISLKSTEIYIKGD